MALFIWSQCLPNCSSLTAYCSSKNSCLSLTSLSSDIFNIIISIAFAVFLQCFSVLEEVQIAWHSFRILHDWYLYKFVSLYFSFILYGPATMNFFLSHHDFLPLQIFVYTVIQSFLHISSYKFQLIQVSVAIPLPPGSPLRLLPPKPRLVYSPIFFQSVSYFRG